MNTDRRRTSPQLRGAVPCAIRADGLARVYSQRTAVDRICLEVPTGSRYGIIGANGSGKTTLMRMFSCVLVPSAGTLEVLGRNVLHDPRWIKQRLGVVPQGMTLDTELTARNGLTTFARYFGMDPRRAGQRADALLELMHLSDYAKARIDELSGGSQRRLLIARALIGEPELILLDEPTTGLDPGGRLLVWDCLAELSKKGTTVVVTTHYLEEVERLCDQVTVVDHGHVIRSCSPQALVTQSVPRHVVEIEAGHDIESLGHDLVRSTRVGERLLLFTDEPAEVLAMLGDGRRFSSPPLIRPSNLEDALLVLAGEGAAGDLAYLDSAQADPGERARNSATRSRNVGGPVLHGVASVWRRNATLFKRAYRTTFVPNFFEPVLYLIALGLGLGSYVHSPLIGDSYGIFIAPGLLAVAAMNGAIFEVTYNIFVRLQHAKSYDAVVTTPMEPPDIALGELLWALTRCVVYGSVFLLLMALLGFITRPTALLVPICLPLIGTTFACIGMLFTSRVRSIHIYSYFYTLFLTPMTLFSGVFFPVNGLPAVGRVLAWFSPLYHGVELMRALATTGDMGTAIAHAAWLAVTSALLARPAVRCLGRHLIQ